MRGNRHARRGDLRTVTRKGTKTMKTLLPVLIGVTLGFASATGSADETDKDVLKLSIERKSLRDALNDWAQQTGNQLIAEIKVDLVAPKVEGRLTAQEALERLLKGTSLTYQWMAERLVAVKEKQLMVPATLQTTKDGRQQPFQVTRFNGDEPREWRVADSPLVAQNSTGTNSMRASRDAKSDGEQLEEVVVTGTHIRGASPTSATVLTISRQEIERTGFSTVEEVMQSLPQNFADLTPGGRFASEGGSSLSTANNDRVTGVNLRGLGAQSTLTLVDGTRVAGSVGGRIVDISMLPLSMIERVEVVTGGHSAIYGSDAVGGVANLVMRRDFSGAQTQLSYGGTSNGGERMQASQLVGAQFEQGGFAAGYDFTRDWPFDLADAGLLSPDFNPVTGQRQLSLQAQADTWRHSAFASGHYSPGDRIEFRGNAFYAYKRYEDTERSILPGAADESVTATKHPAHLYGASGSALISLPQAWRLNTSAAGSTSDLESDGRAFTDFGGGAVVNQTGLRRDRATVSSLSAVADGEVSQLGGITPRVALGVEIRDEKFRGRSAFDGVSDPEITKSRNVRSAFAEVLVPLADDRLELSIAGRYDDYSDFGNTFNPQFGVLWQPIQGLRLRGSYSRSFRAPALAELSRNTQAFMVTVEDPQSLSGTRELVILAGDNPELGPEKAKGWSFGLEFQPASWASTSASIDYFNVEYTDRIEVPVGSFVNRVAALTQEERFQQIINRNPGAATLQEIFDGLSSFFNVSTVTFGECEPFVFCDPKADDLLAVVPDVVLLDDRTHNIATDKVSGLDLLLKSGVTTSVGDFTYGLNLTYALKHDRNVTPTSPSFELLNEVGKPVDLRARANLGWLRGAYGVFAYLNYADAYSNPFSRPPSKMASWTTVDLTARLDGSLLSQTGFLQGIVATLSIENVLDKDPPRYENSSFSILYDATNADPFGRYFSLRLVKTW